MILLSASCQDHQSMQDPEINLMQDQCCPLQERKMKHTTSHNSHSLNSGVFRFYSSYPIQPFNSQSSFSYDFLFYLPCEQRLILHSCLITDKHTQKVAEQKYIYIFAHTLLHVLGSISDAARHKPEL